MQTAADNAEVPVRDRLAPATAMPDTPPPQSLRLKFAAIAAVGAAMVLLPLSQVLRYQNADLETLMAERAMLDPLAHALAVQRSLLGHQDVAERVLHGRLQLEAERRLRKAEVDESLWALQGTLSAGFWVKALDESEALTQDWRTLASRVALRQLQAADSQASHQLLVEQAVQVMDLVSAAAPAGSYAQLLSVKQAGGVGGSARAEGNAAKAVAAAVSQQRLTTIGHALQAHALDLDERTAALRSQQTMLALAWATVAALAALLLGLLASAAIGTSAAPDPSDGVRRSRGRRSGENLEAATPSDNLLQRLRKPSSSAEIEPPESLSPPG